MTYLLRRRCDFGGCSNEPYDDWSVCGLCGAIRCREHNERPIHQCGTPLDHMLCDDEDEMAELQRIEMETRKRDLTLVLQLVREQADQIEQEAQDLRPGHTCQLELPADPGVMLDSKMFTAMNVHFPLISNDGVRWLIRCRQIRSGRPPLAIRQAVLISEVVSLQVMKEQGIAVPNAWLPSHLTREKEYPLDYFSYEFLPGHALSLRTKGSRMGEYSGQKLRDLMISFARAQITIANVPISAQMIGCLYSSPFKADNNKESQAIVGPFVNQYRFQLLDPPYFLGPFKSNKERYLTHIDVALRYIADDAFHDLAPFDAYLWHLELRELVASCKELDQEVEEVYFCHADSKGDHLLINEEGEITGMIDWEWAYLTTKQEAFAAPRFCYGTGHWAKAGSKTSAMEDVLIDCYETLGRPDLAECVRNGPLYLRLKSIGSFAAHGLEDSLRSILAKDKPASLDQSPMPGSQRHSYCTRRYRKHQGLQRLLQRMEWDQSKVDEDARKSEQDSLASMASQTQPEIWPLIEADLKGMLGKRYVENEQAAEEFVYEDLVDKYERMEADETVDVPKL